MYNSFLKKDVSSKEFSMIEPREETGDRRDNPRYYNSPGKTLESGDDKPLPSYCSSVCIV
jgi:hypothetical protein